MYKLLFILIICLSCTSNYKSKQTSFELIIEDANSYKYDFAKGVYTIFFIDSPPKEIKFQLSEKENKKIQDKYYELELEDLPQEIKIEGTCMTMPQIYSVLQIKRNNISQKIEIERGCDNFSILKSGKAKRINKFIDFVYQILNSILEIKNSPKSDILYL